MDHALLDGIFRDRHRRAAALAPLPLWYRLSPATARRIMPPEDMPYRAYPIDATPLPYAASGTLWSIPFVVSKQVPDGEVWFTTDYEAWHKLEGLG